MAVMLAVVMIIIHGQVQSAKPNHELLTARDFLQMLSGTRRNRFRRHGTEKSGIRLRPARTTRIRAAVNAFSNAILIMIGTALSAGDR